jgi:Ca2+-binding RTX toxin-like protein
VVSFAPGSATSGVDYIPPAGGIVHFNANQATAQVTVKVVGDTDVEGDETFFVNVMAINGATIGDGQGVGTIVNDDLPLGTASLIPDPCDPLKTALLLTGTAANDKLELSLDKGLVKAKLNGQELGKFAFDGSIQVHGNAGNDELTVNHAIKKSVFFFGEAGNDTGKGGAGNDVLVGGPGKDRLEGYNGRDILIGGADADKLEGQDGEDVLIAGSTVHDGDPAKLCDLLDEWSRLDQTYAQRVTHLRSGGFGSLNGGTTLDDASLIVDAAVDDLKGNGGDDVFFGNNLGPTTQRDHFGDRRLAEQLFQLG